MAVRSFESFKLIVLTLIAVASAQNEPDFEYECDLSGMNINMTFEYPFRGLVYVKGYVKDTKCRLSLQVPVLEVSLNIPLMACGMYSTQLPWITGEIIVQQHPLIPTINDTSEPLACAIKRNSNVTNWPVVSRNAKEFLKDYPNVVPWLEIGLEGTTPNSSKTNFVAFRVYGASRFNDMLVTECIAHDEKIIDHNTSVYHMTRPIGCSNAFTETLSPFNVTKSSRGVITGAYAELNPSSIPYMKQTFISCSAVLCSEKCHCPQNSSALGYQLIATRELLQRRFKRSVSDKIIPSNNGNKGIRNRLLRSTINALTDRLMKHRRQPRSEKDADFEKRFMSDLDEATTIFSASDDMKLEPTFQENVSTTEFNTDLNINIETQNLDERNFPSNLSALFIPKVELEKFMTNLDNYSTETSFHPEPTFNDQFPATLIPEDDIEKLFHLFDQATEDNLNPDKTFEESNEDLQQNNILIKTNEDFISTINITTETGGMKSGEVVNKTTDNEIQEHSDCVPKLRFVIVTVSLSFIVACLILGCCGFVLYTSKEKKERAIDNFLLYSFY